MMLEKEGMMKIMAMAKMTKIMAMAKMMKIMAMASMDADTDDVGEGGDDEDN